MKTFVWSCAFNGLEAEGIGRSKKEAKAAHESAKADMKAEKKAEKAVPAKAANANKG